MTTAKKNNSLLAAEYALGVLEGDELVRARALLASDQSFVTQVTYWEMRLTGLTEDIEEVVPSAKSKAQLNARLFGAAKSSNWMSWLWPASTIAALLFAVVLLFGDLREPVVGPLYTAEIASSEGDFRVIAVVDKTTNEVILTKTLGDAPEGRILQVWAHGPGEPAESVGLWTPGASTMRLALPPRIAAVSGVLTLGVSEEPVGGSVTGSPSGRVFGTVDIPGVVSEI